MPRIAPAPIEQYAPLVGVDAPLRQQVYAQAPELVGPYLEFMTALRDYRALRGKPGWVMRNDTP